MNQKIPGAIPGFFLPGNFEICDFMLIFFTVILKTLINQS